MLWQWEVKLVLLISKMRLPALIIFGPFARGIPMAPKQYTFLEFNRLWLSESDSLFQYLGLKQQNYIWTNPSHLVLSNIDLFLLPVSRLKQQHAQQSLTIKVLLLLVKLQPLCKSIADLLVMTMVVLKWGWWWWWWCS